MHMLYQLLMRSLSLSTKHKIMLRKVNYTISIPTNAHDFFVRYSPLQDIATVLHIVTNTSASALRFKISNLNEHIVKIGSDIPSFNQHVKTLVEGLATHGATSSNLLH